MPKLKVTIEDDKHERLKDKIRKYIKWSMYLVILILYVFMRRDYSANPEAYQIHGTDTYNDDIINWNETMSEISGCECQAEVALDKVYYWLGWLKWVAAYIFLMYFVSLLIEHSEFVKKALGDRDEDNKE